MQIGEVTTRLETFDVG